MEMEKYYNMIGTSQSSILYKIKMENLSQEKVNEFLKEKMMSQIKLKNNRKNLAEKEGNEIKVQELEKEIEDIKNAYEKIRNHKIQINDNFSKEENKKEKVEVEKSPYEILDCSQEDLKLEPKQLDQILEMRAKAKKSKILKEKENISKGRYTDIKNLEKQIKEIEEAYEKIKSEDNRKIYDNSVHGISQKKINETFENLKKAIFQARKEMEKNPGKRTEENSERSIEGDSEGWGR